MKIIRNILISVFLLWLYTTIRVLPALNKGSDNWSWYILFIKLSLISYGLLAVGLSFMAFTIELVIQKEKKKWKLVLSLIIGIICFFVNILLLKSPFAFNMAPFGALK